MTQAVILLAGMGSRLGRPHPKSLTPLASGESILARQLRMLERFELQPHAVVGFKMDLIMEAAPHLLFAYNPNYDTTNTAKSLLCGLKHIHDEDVLWMNGDVVFEPEVLAGVLESDDSVVAVNNARVGEEEVKYTLNADGFIDRISKTVDKPLGEALGINLIRAPYLADFKAALAEVGDNDYFERAMELLIERRGNVFRPADVGAHMCVEVDFDADLERANTLFD